MKRIFLFFVLSFLLGCVGSNPTRLYVLRPSEVGTNPNFTVEAHPSTSSAKNKAQSVKIGIQPVELPGYLDRSQIVTEISANQLAISNLDEWAEPLKDNLTRLVLEELTNSIGPNNIVALPVDDDSQLTHKLAVRIMRFETLPSHEAVVEARWFITSVRDKRQIFTNHVIFQQPATELTPEGTRVIAGEKELIASTYQGQISALNSVFHKLTRSIVEACNLELQQLQEAPLPAKK